MVTIALLFSPEDVSLATNVSFQTLTSVPFIYRKWTVNAEQVVEWITHLYHTEQQLPWIPVETPVLVSTCMEL